MNNIYLNKFDDTNKLVYLFRVPSGIHSVV